MTVVVRTARTASRVTVNRGGLTPTPVRSPAPAYARSWLRRAHFPGSDSLGFGGSLPGPNCRSVDEQTDRNAK